MMDEFQWLLTQYNEKLSSSLSQKDDSVDTVQQEDLSAITSDSKIKKCNNPDIDILKDTFGELTEGKEIILPLQDACKLLNRTRIRTDAFKTLQKNLLKEYGVKLKITSRKNK